MLRDCYDEGHNEAFEKLCVVSGAALAMASLGLAGAGVGAGVNLVTNKSDKSDKEKIVHGALVGGGAGSTVMLGGFGALGGAYMGDRIYRKMYNKKITNQKKEIYSV